jgi:hypothetical protein
MELLADPIPAPALALPEARPVVADDPRSDWHADYEEIE